MTHKEREGERKRERERVKDLVRYNNETDGKIRLNEERQVKRHEKIQYDTIECTTRFTVERKRTRTKTRTKEKGQDPVRHDQETDG